jgi:hypothetical protein
MSEDFCTRLVAALEVRNISRNELVKQGYEGLTYRKVHAYCTGETPPPVEFLVMLGQMGFDLHQLLLGQPAVASLRAGGQSGSDPGSQPGNGRAGLLDQLEAALRATQSALAQIAPLAAEATASTAPLTPDQLSPQERHIIARLRSMPERQEMLLAMLTPCPRCAVRASDMN